MPAVQRTKIIILGAFLAGLPLLPEAAGPADLEISPSVFDFGWSPDNAKVSCEFTVKNRGSDMVPLVGVQPTCGCTASHFTPGELSSQEEAKIGLTFNTRGYAKMKFDKAAKVKTDVVAAEYSVRLKGHVLDPNALVAPVGDGIAGFDAGTKEKRKTIQIENKSVQEVTLQMVQKPADWAKVRLRNETVAPGQTVDLDISVSGSLEEARDTSVTFAALTENELNRFTVAIRTGPPPAPYKRYQPPATAPK